MTNPQRDTRQISLFESRPKNSTELLPILLISSQEQLTARLAEFASPDWRITQASSGARALAMLAATPCEILILDGPLPDLDSAELGRMILGSFPHLSVIAAQAGSSRESFHVLREKHPATIAVLEALRSLSPHGAETSPATTIAATARSPQVQQGASALHPEPAEPSPELLPQVLGSSAPMSLVSRLVRLVAGRNSTVLLTGETGTGKERIAQAIHKLSPRGGNPFVVVNCGAIPETLFEAELFGFERGAFTGAQQSRMGKIQAARSGTLFLDEIGELPLAMQAKLLRFLQEREVQRLGSTEATRVDVRVIAATNADLKQMSEAGAFRRDLYYRLNVFPIALPPLRQRREDILVLARHFLQRYCRESGSPTKQFAPPALEALRSYDWPGNVRELEHVIERAFIFAESSSEVCVEIPTDEHSMEPLPTVESTLPSTLRMPVGRAQQLEPAEELPAVRELRSR